jgi:2-aminoethylphosphonate-pyruvate transaminase
MLLLIPGPVATAPAVKAALAHDFAPWDNDFRDFFARLRDRVLAVAGGVAGEHIALPLQGCGHFITEAAVRTFVPAGAKLLLPMTGAYASRMERLAREAGRIVVKLPVERGSRAAPEAIAAALATDPSIRHLGVVYSETGSGVIHDVQAIGRVARQAGVRMIVDAVSAFGALPFDLAAQPETDAIVFTSNKCLEGVPGTAFAVARIDRLVACVGQSGSWSLDLSDLYEHTLRSGAGRSRFTPAPQVLNALNTALDLYDAEGGQAPRLARYQANARTLYDGMRALGLTPWLSPELQGPIVMNVHAPTDPAWDLQSFVDALKRRGVLISNFYNTDTPTFRVGCIGAITPADMARAVTAIGEALDELGIHARKAA